MGSTESSEVVRVSSGGFGESHVSRTVIGLVLFSVTLFSCAYSLWVPYGSAWHTFAIIVCVAQGVLAIPLVVLALVLPRTVPNLDVAPPAMATRLAELPRLHRLRCPSCGDEAPLAATAKPCASCGTPVSVPPDVADAVSLRAAASIQLGHSARLLQWAGRISRGRYRFLLFWLAVAMLCFGPFSGAVVARYSHGVAIIGAAMAGAASIALGLAMFRVRRILRDARRVLPGGVLFASPPPGPEQARCSGCGGELDFAAGQVAQFCAFCGSETLRSRIAVETSLRDAWSAHRSLTESASLMAELSRALLRTVRRTVYAVVIAMVIGAGTSLAAYLDDDPSAPPPTMDRFRATTGKRHKASRPHRPPANR
jgi:hypothetical protein